MGVVGFLLAVILNPGTTSCSLLGSDMECLPLAIGPRGPTDDDDECEGRLDQFLNGLETKDGLK
ncbi:hypothetical protein EJB05_18028 [Eragrostis curvula]|uniref:Uncharacterized protein n=1 Tax=Eragrostis curvula TaxID=38414 RepID=A0A5J9VIE0_9POAL|nr:hypothetical protein EJB05_18028 [Eragrostis curvula]